MPPVIAAGFHGNRGAGAAINQHAFYGGALRHRVIHRFLQLHFRAAPVTRVLRDHRRRPAIVDTIDQSLRGKSAEDHRVRRADTRAGQQGDGKFGDHAHVNGHAVTLLYAE